ncbi:hypothetical protein [Brevibacillus sp. SIMBA_040]|uniref:hypothetical protein n=1 Tax=unclassified Brevibacillus TaxID=2684853 RepID=UPI00397AC233
MSKRGGKREGAGRKKQGIIRKVSVNMPQEFWDFADSFETFTDCIKELWKLKDENSNRNQMVDNGYLNQGDEFSNQYKPKEIGNQIQIDEVGNQNLTTESLTDAEKRKVTKESKFIFDDIGFHHSKPTVFVIGRFEQIGSKLAPYLYEKLLTRKFEEKHLAAIHESWTQYRTSQQKLEEFRRQQDHERQERLNKRK